MNQREYERLKKQFKEDYEKKLAALELIYRESNSHLNEIVDEIPKKKRVRTESFDRERIPGVRDLILEVLPQVGETFTLYDIEDLLVKKDNEVAARIKRPTISSILKRFEEEEKINVIERGIGKRPNIYSLPKLISNE